MAQLLFIENEIYNVGISTKGAEFQSLYFKPTGYNYLWDADPAYWGKHAPVLFPIVGGLKNDSYTYQGKTYQMGRHGFARDMEFTVASHEGNRLVLELRSTPETMDKYPFPFLLKVTYSLLGEGFECRYEVFNTGEEDMLFSIGAHPAFNVPLHESGRFEDCSIVFNSDEKLVAWKLDGNLLSGETREIGLNGGTLPLSHELFAQDALVLKDLKSNSVLLFTEREEHGVEMDFEGFTYFGIWSAKDAPFVCLEPWCGVADSVNATGQLEQKEGIIKLPAEEMFDARFVLRCF